MEEYYIEDDRADIEVYYLDTLDFDSDDLEKIEDAFEDRSTFKIMYFMDEVIVEKIGMPPNGSGFDFESNESDHGNTYYSLIFKYNPKKKSHNKYLDKIINLFYSEVFTDYCNSIFEERYLSFLQSMND